MGGAVALGIVIGVTGAIVVYLVASMLRHMAVQKKNHRLKKTWRNFGLSIAFCVLFFASWIGQGVAEWQTFVDEQRAHQEQAAFGDFTAEFLQSTLENWQSEFLQLFSFVVLSALLIHHGSAESKDSDDRIEEALKRIEDRLDKANA